MDDFKLCVSELIQYLRSRKMCRSSVQSHKECYETLCEYLENHNINYSRNACENWLRSIQQELVSNKFDI